MLDRAAAAPPSVATGTIARRMDAWYAFWMVSFALAGSAFAAIAAIVLVRGIADLRQMLAGLRNERRP